MYIPKKVVVDLTKFRALMGCNLTEEKARYIWGKNSVKNSDISFGKEQTNEYVDSKIELAKKNVKFLCVGNVVKFIGVSGSVAAGFAKEEDDIDVFVVVKNDTAWIYRALLVFKNIFHHRIRTKWDGERVKDKFCLNLICEERDVVFEDDMFNFHELMYLVPIFNEKYLNYVYSRNVWLREIYGVKGELMVNRVSVSKRMNVFFKILNFKAFFFQLVFMILSKHSPEIPRLKENFKRGRIEFFPRDYKEKRMESYLK
ncbi:MAG: hypothetical protein UR96_C0027G0008 [candidate division WS6 bacterium GW2011_GWC1_36_11]|uniref:Polymerase nucleotidyl transferase domain-containing protein n=2 Tax=Candidatus Dojkabacteria TaxID=74243 RepID=A0A0G0GJK8_9BACT|nr:MAG: hypothetical protein UR96_C0027G0008 [candidate division WS6 bacterium GW2011_GWC1_36_11]KKQ03166.1 MAG: hypothetical protein US14_C0038G0006 [candidate division WS6 bacterium GW2011_WS6_36_26]KKQ17947.1 MAG: hypothetical protein US29_C0002G0007 [candidate division WS6 bacterium GW2011_GWF1_36_8]HAM96791.1 hypothetical protein [Patescibacteria group bacterium]